MGHFPPGLKTLNLVFDCNRHNYLSACGAIKLDYAFRVVRSKKLRVSRQDGFPEFSGVGLCLVISSYINVFVVKPNIMDWLRVLWIQIVECQEPLGKVEFSRSCENG